MSAIHKNKTTSAAPYQKTALIVIPLIGILAQTNSASAQVIRGSEEASTVVDVVEENIKISGGHASEDGSNLFHSFEQFDLGREQTANFITDASIQNVVGSIGGGTASTINGKLQVSGSNANLYLMNPAGILFGPDAKLNLSGDLTATTADRIDFAGEQFVANESTNYGSFVGMPTAFQFSQEQAGAVVNLGALEVDSGQSISLIGGTVVNTGSLKAPGGNVTIAAVEGGDLIRLSQQQQLLSLEIAAAESSAVPNVEVSPTSISEMLTGSGLSYATKLETTADGTVRLTGAAMAISETGGSAIASGTLSTADRAGGGNINVLGSQISLQDGTFDASGRNEDEFGTVLLASENITIADGVALSNTATTAYFPSSYIEGLSTNANVKLMASNNIIIEEISNNKLDFKPSRLVTFIADADGDLVGEFLMRDRNSQINVAGGSISISGAGITAGEIRTDFTATRENSGDITLTSSQGIDVDSIHTNVYFEGNNAGDGGKFRAEATNGDITIQDIIKTWSYSGRGNNSGKGGDIELISSSNVEVKGEILSLSRASRNNAQSGGNVTIRANNNIDVAGMINTSSRANNSNTGDAGTVWLDAGNSVFVRDKITATSSGKGNNGNIFLMGDRIDLLGGAGSVSGKSIWFSPASEARDLNIGISVKTDGTLDISETDLAAISTVEGINIGRADSTGRVSLFSENIGLVNEQFPIRLLGGMTLASQSIDSNWAIEGFDRGTVNGFSFENIGNLKGGNGEDFFKFEVGGGLSGEVVGGSGVDTIDFTNSAIAATSTAFSEIETVIGKLPTEEPEMPVEPGLSGGLELPVEIEIPEKNRRENATETIALDPLIQELQGKQEALLSAMTGADQASEPASTVTDLSRLIQNRTTKTGEIASTFSQVEAGISGSFRGYLGLPEMGEGSSVETVGSVQTRLQEVEGVTGIRPALMYAYFVPDAESQSAVVAGSDRTAQSDDQLEVMLITQEGTPIKKRQWGITRAQVDAANQNMRQQITSQFSTARQYLEPAQQLYDWLIRPIAKELDTQGVESLGFVMDDGLRTLPIAALHNGDRYLVEDYSVGLLPSFSLTAFERAGVERIDFADTQVLAMGASEFEDQPALPAVSVEIDLITQQLWQGDAFLNEDFVIENLQGQIREKEYGIIHLATHASFEAGNLENSYIQMWDDKLSLTDVKELGLDDSDIGLIILSACNTALGDRASEYGFAGFAVTAGSQSALASLWPVSDEGTLGFMSQFYGKLKQAPIRADALRQAQVSLIRGDVGVRDGSVYGPNGDEIAQLPSLAESGRWDFSHPFYWSAFTMIGNPW